MKVNSVNLLRSLPAVVVTGVSTGIGHGTARVLLAGGFRVFGSVRKAADAERLTSEFGPNFHSLLFDVTDEGAVEAAAATVRPLLAGRRLAGLVNNAGIALPGPLLHQPIAEFRRQLEVNLMAPLIVTQAFAPLLGTDPTLAGAPGRIVNVSSVGGRLAPPFLGAYVASKHGLEGLSASLRRELMLYGIDVIVVGPGAVATAIWDKAEAFDASQYHSTDYAASLERFRQSMVAEGRQGDPPERIGETIREALSVPRPRVRYAPVAGRLLNWVFPRLLPARMLDRLLAGRFALARR